MTIIKSLHVVRPKDKNNLSKYLIYLRTNPMNSKLITWFSSFICLTLAGSGLASMFSHDWLRLGIVNVYILIAFLLGIRVGRGQGK